MPKLVITGATGKLGGATLQAILQYSLLDPKELVICTSSDPTDARWDSLKQKGAQVRQGTFDDESSLVKAFADCERLFIVSTPRISMDFNYAPYGEGREKHHFTAINAARTAGVKHIYYSSLGFQSHSKARVMVAHNRTEDVLEKLTDTRYTIIREGLYNESWPLYLGYFDKAPQRKEVVVGGDGPISWASISDLGLATALICLAPSDEYAGKRVTLSSTTSHTLKDVAGLVSSARGEPVELKVVPREQYVDHYVKEQGMDRPAVDWWSWTFEAVKDGETLNHEKTMEQLLALKGRKPQPLEETVKNMVQQKGWSRS